jgi:hypothetical protein
MSVWGSIFVDTSENERRCDQRMMISEARMISEGFIFQKFAAVCKFVR